MTRTSVLLLTTAFGIAVGAPAASIGPPPEMQEPSSVAPDALEDVGIDQRIGEPLPLDSAWRDEAGHQVRLGDYFGEAPVVLVPAYYDCPMLCTLVVEGVARSLRALTFGAETEYELVVFSFDPTETPEQAAERKARAREVYGRDGSEEGWHFLTGGEESITRLTEAIGFRAAFDETTGEYLHAAAIVLATPDGVVSRYFYGIDQTPKDLRLGLVEASGGELGTPVDQVLLYCFRYDPSTGKYTMLTMRLVRIGAIVTVLGLAAMIGTFVRLERSRQTPSEGLAH